MSISAAEKSEGLSSGSSYSPFSPRRALAILCRGFESSLVQVGILCLCIALAYIYILLRELQYVGRLGFAMDDAWIHIAVARNFIEGQGWGIEPGRTLSISTSPTWTLLVALFHLVFGDPVWAVLSLSVCCMFGAALCCYFLVLLLTGRKIFAFIGTLVFLSHPTILWGMASGMELPLVEFVLFATVLAYYASESASKKRLFLVPFLLGLSAITRPELFVLIPLALFDTFRNLCSLDDADARTRAFRTLFVQIAIIILTLAPYFIFNKLSGGLWFPTTYYAKTRIRGVGLSAALRSQEWKWIYRFLVVHPVNQVFEIVSFLLGNNALLFLLLPIGMISFATGLAKGPAARGILLGLAIVVLPYAMGVTAPARFLSNHASRYYVIFPVMASVLAAVGLSTLAKVSRSPVPVVLCCLFILSAPLRTTPETIELLVSDVDSTETMYRPIGEWIKKNMDPKAVLAVNDIGVIGYYANRPLIDVMGLATPEIWPAIERGPGKKIDFNKMRAYLQDHKVDYIVLSPLYYPDLTADKEAFEPLLSWKERYPHGRFISPQVLYRCHWPAPQLSN